MRQKSFFYLLEQRRDLLSLLIARDFRSRYKQARLGMLWAVVSPLLFLGVFYVLFGYFLDLGIPNYASFVFTGIIVWNWTQSALLSAAVSMSSNPSLVMQPGFPLSVLPIVSVGAALLNLLIAFPLLVGFAFLEGATPGLTYLALPVVLLVQFFFSLGLCYFIAALNVAYRDIEQILPVILQLGYYATPIFYSRDILPASARPVFDLNPLAGLIGAYRNIVLEDAWPDWIMLAAIAGVALLLTTFGKAVFESSRQSMLEKL